MIEEQPLFSVITVVRNDLQGLQATRASLDTQTHRSFEWVVIDGASTDSTADYVKSLQHVGFTCSERDSGIFDAMNKGLRHAKGKFVLFLNAGDLLYHPDALQNVARALEPEPNAGIVVCGAEFLMAGGKRFVQGPRELDYVRHSLPNTHQAMLFRTEIHKRIPFNTQLVVAADYDVICRFYVDRAVAVYVPDILSKVWRGNDSFSIKHPFIGIRDMAGTQRRVLHLSRLTIALSAVRRFLPIVAYRAMDVPVVSSVAYHVVRLLRPTSAAARS